MCFSDTRTDVPNSTDLDNTRKRKADHTAGGTDEHGRSHRCSVAAASSTSWFVEQPETDTTDRSTWLPTFTKQPGYIGQKRMANAEPYEFLELFLDESFWELLTVETNRYMACNKALSKAQEKQLQVLDYVTVPEIKTFFALYFAMGIVSQCNLRDYWQTKNVITQTPAFHDVMSRNRWCAIWTHLHFSDNTKAFFLPMIQGAELLMGQLLCSSFKRNVKACQSFRSSLLRTIFSVFLSVLSFYRLKLRDFHFCPAFWNSRYLNGRRYLLNTLIWRPNCNREAIHKILLAFQG